MDQDSLISTSALFHYTRPAFLENIIRDGFKPRVSWETFDIEKSETAELIRKAFGHAPSTSTSFTIGIPMICF